MSELYRLGLGDKKANKKLALHTVGVEFESCGILKMLSSCIMGIVGSSVFGTEQFYTVKVSLLI